MLALQRVNEERERQNEKREAEGGEIQACEREGGDEGESAERERQWGGGSGKKLKTRQEMSPRRGTHTQEVGRWGFRSGNTGGPRGGAMGSSSSGGVSGALQLTATTTQTTHGNTRRSLIDLMLTTEIIYD